METSMGLNYETSFTILHQDLQHHGFTSKQKDYNKLGRRRVTDKRQEKFKAMSINCSIIY